MIRCLIGIGSNLGSRSQWLDHAVAALKAWSPAKVVRVSRWYETQPVGGPQNQPSFLNGAVLLDVGHDVAAHTVLRHLLDTEIQLGRRREQRWGPRNVDLDLLQFGTAVDESAELVLPHPWMAIRTFVLEPVVEIAPDMSHPVFGLTMQQLWDNLRQQPQLLAVAGALTKPQREAIHRAADSSQFDLVCLPESLSHHDRAVPQAGNPLELASQFLHIAAAEWQAKGHGERRNTLVDFWWPEQSLGHPEVELESLTGLLWQAPTENLVIVVDNPSDPLNGERLRQVRRVRRGRGPFLKLDGSCLKTLEHDVAAAIAGMFSPA